MHLLHTVTFLVEFGCSNCFFLQYYKSDYVKVRISRSVLEGSFDFEIKRVDCSCIAVLLKKPCHEERSLHVLSMFLLPFLLGGTT